MDKTAPLSADMLKGIVGGSAKQRGPHMTDLLIVETENGVEVHNPATKQDDARLAAPKLDGAPSKADLALHTGAPVPDEQANLIARLAYTMKHTLKLGKVATEQKQ